MPILAGGVDLIWVVIFFGTVIAQIIKARKKGKSLNTWIHDTLHEVVKAGTQQHT